MCVRAHRSKDVLRFPPIQRHRYYRLKQAFFPACFNAARMAAASLVACLAVPTLAGGWWLWGFSLRTVGALAWGGTLCALCWLLGSAALEAVMTERLRPDDYSDENAVEAMMACLAGQKVGRHTLRPSTSAAIAPLACTGEQLWALPRNARPCAPRCGAV